MITRTLEDCEPVDDRFKAILRRCEGILGCVLLMGHVHVNAGEGFRQALDVVQRGEGPRRTVRNTWTTDTAGSRTEALKDVDIQLARRVTPGVDIVLASPRDLLNLPNDNALGLGHDRA